MRNKKQRTWGGNEEGFCSHGTHDADPLRTHCYHNRLLYSKRFQFVLCEICIAHQHRNNLVEVPQEESQAVNTVVELVVAKALQLTSWSGG